MNEKKYTDKSIGKVKIVKDFLPNPKELALKKVLFQNVWVAQFIISPNIAI